MYIKKYYSEETEVMVQNIQYFDLGNVKFTTSMILWGYVSI